MEQDSEKKEKNIFTEIYETPRLNVVEIEIEGLILQVSGEDSTNQTW